MKKKILKLFENREGFTLAEIMVVVVIIGLLAGLVLPKIFPKLAQGKKGAAKAQIELLGEGLDSFRMDVGTYPSTSEGLNALLQNPGTDNWDGPYLKKNVIPNDPWKKPYVYQCPGSHSDYDLLSYGRDGTPGGEGEDADIVSWE